jgi:hypothetical protein
MVDAFPIFADVHNHLALCGFLEFRSAAGMEVLGHSWTVASAFDIRIARGALSAM